VPGLVPNGGDQQGSLGLLHARWHPAQVLICPALHPDMACPYLDDHGVHRDEMRFF
jgi:hypothetical protein